MRLTDTSSAARAIQTQIQRTLTPEQGISLAFEMSLFARDLARLRIQQEHPDWTAAQVARELLRLAFLPRPLPEKLP